VYVPGLWTIPPIDRDESRFAQASRQMFESVALPPDERDLDPATGVHRGGLVVPMVGGEPRLKKPPLIYWLQSASAAVMTGGDPSRDAIWMYRLPSLVASILTVLMTWRLGRSMFDARAAWLGAALLGVAPVFVWEAHQARADQVLVAWTTLAMWALWESFKGRGRDGVRVGDAREGGVDSGRRGAASGTGVRFFWPMVFWIGVAGGIMTKGPITPMVAGLGAIALVVVTRRWSLVWRLKPLLGVVIVAVAVGPWVSAVVQRVGWDVYLDTIRAETLGRAGSAMEGHWGPPGYHLALFFVLFWPGSLLTILAVKRAVKRGFRRRRRSAARTDTSSRSRAFIRSFTSLAPGRRAELFCLAWIVPSWLVFELVSTKLPHYTMPLFPPIAMLTARALLAAGAGSVPGAASRLAHLGHRLWIVIGLLLCVAVPVALMVFADWHGPRGVVMSGFAIGAVVVAHGLLVFAALSLRKARWVRVQWCGIGALLTLGAVLGVTLPRTSVAFISPKIIAATDRADPAQARPVAIISYHEDSLIYLSRSRIALIAGQDAARWLDDNRNGLLWAPPTWANRWTAESTLELFTVEPNVEVTGFNYANGRSVVLRLYSGTP
jgi:4-amino-4-deoxy-L-arabinose transferase-like glycosyltransferase